MRQFLDCIDGVNRYRGIESSLTFSGRHFTANIWSVLDGEGAVKIKVNQEVQSHDSNNNITNESSDKERYNLNDKDDSNDN